MDALVCRDIANHSGSIRGFQGLYNTTGNCVRVHCVVPMAKSRVERIIGTAGDGSGRMPRPMNSSNLTSIANGSSWRGSTIPEGQTTSSTVPNVR